MVGEWIEKSYGVSYTRSALIKLLQRNDMEYRKPKLVPRKLDPAKQQALSTVMKICSMTSTLIKPWCSLTPHIDALKKSAAGRLVWVPKDTKVTLEGTSGRNAELHGAVDLETGATGTIEVTAVDAASTIALLMAIVMMYLTKRCIYVFLDNQLVNDL